MNTFLPSEISRLTYDYLRTHCDQNLAEEFSKSCPSMKECRQMKHKYGRNFYSTVQDLTLETILDQYSRLCSSIFKYFDEDKRQHRNVMNLLEIILKKHQPEQSTCKSDARVFRDVQNIPSYRNIPESQITEARGREIKPLAPKGIEMSANQCTRMSPSKKKPASSIQLADQETIVTTKLLSTEAETVSPDYGGKVSQNIDPGRDYSSNLNEDQQAAAEVDSCETRSNVLISSHPPLQKSIPHSSNNFQLKEVGQSIDSGLTNSSEKPNNLCPIPVLKEVIEETDRQDTESFLLEPIPVKIGNVNFDNSNNQSVTSSNDSSRLKLTFETHSLTLARKDETSVIVENEQTEKSSSETINSQENPISLSKSAKIVSSGHSVSPPPFVQADWKTIFSNSFKIPTPRKGKSQKMPASREKTASKSTGTPSEAIKEAVPPQECIQVFFENLSKGFKHRPHPYLSPAKSKGLLHQAALSPLSKMYVTPTKPNSLNTAALNLSVASNATSSSSISSSQRSIFSPVSLDSPFSKEILAREEPKEDDAEEKLSSKRVSTAEEKVSAKRKRCHHQKQQLSYGVNDEIVKKINKISNNMGSHINTTLVSHSICIFCLETIGFN